MTSRPGTLAPASAGVRDRLGAIDLSLGNGLDGVIGFGSGLVLPSRKQELEQHRPLELFERRRDLMPLPLRGVPLGDYAFGVMHAHPQRGARDPAFPYLFAWFHGLFSPPARRARYESIVTICRRIGTAFATCEHIP
jgi:hypothetical protein